MRAVAESAAEHHDPWEVQLNVLRAHATLDRLAPHHRAALTWRYLDDLPVPEVAVLLDRTLRADDGWNVDGVTPMAGMHGGHEQATVVPMYRVDDIAAAADRVRRAGGAATAPQRRPYGLEASCADDQGTRFYLGQL